MNYVIFRGTHSSVIMNRNFYNNGHLLIVQHTYGFDIEKLPVKKDRCPHEGHTAFVKMLKHVLSHDGCNAGDHIGKSAGAGIPCTCMCRWFHMERRYGI